MVAALGLAAGPVERALRAVAREAFLPEDARSIAYEDTPVSLGRGESTASAPHMVAIMLETLGPQSGEKVLEVGGGMGYLAALLAELVAPNGHVDTIELDPYLAVEARRRLASQGYEGLVTVHPGDGSAGLPQRAPFHGIVVSCAAPELFPAWTDQLVEGGRLVAPIGGRVEQQLLLYRRSGSSGSVERGPRVRFVPLRTRSTPHI
ncbi:MAG TPA: protein-L-isoaspartate O-methyltransferase [Thermoplasmata archaeon]